jgi:hypothetical protein
MGSLYKVGLHFDEAIYWELRASKIDPKHTAVLSNLATTCSRYYVCL